MDSRTAHGVGKMFPGTVGGQVRPAQPHTPPTIRPVRRPFPLLPPILNDTAGEFDYYHNLFQWPTPADDADEEIVYGDLIAYEGPGVSHSAAAVYPGRVGGPGAWHVPALLIGRIELWFDFQETEADTPGEAITRELHLVVTRDSDSATLADVTETYSGTRLLTVGHLVYGPRGFPDAFTIHTYCNWGTKVPRTPGQFAYNVHDGLVIEVTGVFAP